MAELPQFKSFDVLEFYSQAKLHDLLNGLLFQDPKGRISKEQTYGQLCPYNGGKAEVPDGLVSALPRCEGIHHVQVLCSGKPCLESPASGSLVRQNATDLREMRQ
jgi:hypothetical protein